MKVWIVVDNNDPRGLILYDNEESAIKHTTKYPSGSPEWGDCWIYNEDGTEVEI